MSSFCKCKSYSHFFSKNISIYTIFNNQNFNDTLTNHIISFEQLGPDHHHIKRFWSNWISDPIPSHYLESPLGKETETNRGEYERVYTATVDQDVAKMENLMDQWCLDLKRNVLVGWPVSEVYVDSQQLFVTAILVTHLCIAIEKREFRYSQTSIAWT